jgi:hypothetical protein
LIEELKLKDEEWQKRFDQESEKQREAGFEKDNQITKMERLLKEKAYELT